MSVSTQMPSSISYMRHVTHQTNALFVWGEEERKKKFTASAAMLKVIVQQLDTLRCSTGSLTCK